MGFVFIAHLYRVNTCLVICLLVVGNVLSQTFTEHEIQNKRNEREMKKDCFIMMCECENMFIVHIKKSLTM